MFPPDVLQSVAVYHVNASTGDYPATADATIQGAFLPLGRYEGVLEGGLATVPFELYVAVDAGIRESDKLVINSTTYFVKFIFQANFGGLAHNRISLSTER